MKGEREMFNGTNGYSLSDIAAVNGNNNDCFGGNNGAWWIIILFLFAFCGWGNGYGWGGNGAGQGPTSVYEGYVLSNDMNMLSRQLSDGFNSQERKLDSISNGICSLGYDQLAQINGINTNIMTTGNAIQTQLADCCCKTQSNIKDVQYQIATDTCAVNTNVANVARDIIDNQNANTRSILDFIIQDKLSTLQSENQSLRLAASQAAQNQYLVNELRPCPIPAYITCNPYAASYGYPTNGYGYGCGTCA